MRSAGQAEQPIRNTEQQDGQGSPSYGIWRIHLAQVLAERDRLEEAVALFEADGKRDRLTAEEWQQLSVWQHALDRRADSEASLRQVWLHSAPETLASQLNAELQQWQANPNERTPTVPESVKERLGHLLHKTSQPEHAIQLISAWYATTHDPLVLNSFAYFVTGRAEGDLFASMESSQSLIHGIDQEAGIDAIYESIKQARAGRPTKTNAQLALDLLELQVATAGARMLNQPEPHVQRAIKLLQKLTEEDWQSGQRLPFAQQLHNITIEDERLRAERRRSLVWLLQAEPPASTSRLELAALTGHLMASEKRSNEAVHLMESELRSAMTAMLETVDGKTSNGQPITDVETQAVSLLNALVPLLQKKEQFQAAERWLMETDPQLELTDRAEMIFNNHLAALGQGGRTSLGSGVEIYAALRDKKLAEVLDPDNSANFISAWQQQLSVLINGNTVKVPDIATDVRQLVTTHTTELLRRRSDHSDTIFVNALRLLQETNQRMLAIEFLVDRLKSQPLALQWTQPRHRWENFADDLFELASERITSDDGSVTFRIHPELRRLRGEKKSL